MLAQSWQPTPWTGTDEDRGVGMCMPIDPKHASLCSLQVSWYSEGEGVLLKEAAGFLSEGVSQ